ncbi:MAG TPA: hypothetical protein VEW73_10730 [Nocardioides sp.]|nr:hypothetical protein [Nocardioides sp.]
MSRGVGDWRHVRTDRLRLDELVFLDRDPDDVLVAALAGEGMAPAGLVP